MRNPIVSLCVIAFALAACGGDGTTTTGSPAATSGVAGAPVSTGAQPAAAGAGAKPGGTPTMTATAGSGSTTKPPATTGNTGTTGTVTTPPGSGGTAGAGTGTAPTSGAAGAAGGGTKPGTPATGAAGSAPSTGAAGGGGTTTGADGKTFASDPVIPEAMGECPMFESGRATIMGANVTFLAQKKAESGGYLVFYWHGTGSSPIEGSMFAGMNDIMSKGGLVVGFNTHAGGGDCSGTGTHSIGDFNVADQIVACGVKNFGIDPKRIYATGCSAGGLQSGCMGINRSNYMAAVVPNSGGATIGYGPFQDVTRVPATMTMHGAPGADVVIVDFSQTSEGYDNYMLAKGASIVVNCNHGGGHCGAGAVQASAWQFMQDHPFGIRPSPYAGGLPSGFSPTCKIFDTPTDVLLIGERMGGGAPMGGGP